MSRPSAGVTITLSVLAAALMAAVFYFSAEGNPPLALVAVASPFLWMIVLTMRHGSLAEALRYGRRNPVRPTTARFTWGITFALMVAAALYLREDGASAFELLMLFVPPALTVFFSHRLSRLPLDAPANPSV